MYNMHPKLYDEVLGEKFILYPRFYCTAEFLQIIKLNPVLIDINALIQLLEKVI